MVAIATNGEEVSETGSDAEGDGSHDRGDGESLGTREEDSEDSDGSRSGQDNRERLLQAEIVELKKEVARLKSQSRDLFIMVVCALLPIWVWFAAFLWRVF